MEDRTLSSIARHRLKVALYQPQIAPNTGNIARLCVATGTALHLIRPLGFALTDRNLKRSAMDYWPRLCLTIHDDSDAFFASIEQSKIWLLSSKGTRSLWNARFAADDCLLFGNETSGVPAQIQERLSSRSLRIPQIEGERCLNLATAAGVAVYEAIRQIQDAK